MQEIVEWRPKVELTDKLIVIAAVIAIVPVVAYLYVNDPEAPGQYPICPFLGLTGYHCPGCGTLRAIYQLCHGNLVTAMGFNPFTVMTLPFIGYAFLSRVASALNGRRLPTAYIPSIWIWGLLALVVSFWVLRNVPLEPLTVLAP